MLWATEDSLVEEVTLRRGAVCPVPVVARSDRGNGKLAACELSKGTAVLTDLNALRHGKTTALEAGRHEFRLILRQPDGYVIAESPPFVIEIPPHRDANDRGFDLLLGAE
jgi:hypothetical protein